MVGPIFVPVPVGDRTTMLAIGSGVWHWGDLLPRPLPVETDRTQPLNASNIW